MSGISSSVGAFSGIDRESIIRQLLAIEGRPKDTAQRQIVTYKSLQTALLDINSRLSALKSASTKFNLSRVFEASAASSSNEDVLTASAGAGATAGSYTFTVDRLVSTQQILSRGFADSTQTSVGASSFSFEPAAGRLDSQTRLATLNGGAGVPRGSIQIRDSSGTTTTVDLSRAETVTEVVKAVNDALGTRGNLSIDGDRLVLTDSAGGAGTIAVTDAAGSSGTAAGLGLTAAASGPGDGEAIFGAQINKLGTGATLRSLNDGLGVSVSQTAGTSATPDFVIKTRDGSSLQIDIGDIYSSEGARTATAVSTLGGVIERINSQGGGKVTASIDPSGTGLRLTDNTSGATTFEVTEYATGSSTGTTARDLGLLGSADGGAGTITGKRLITKINSALISTLRGGAGLPSGAFSVTARDGSQLDFSVGTTGSVSDLIADVSSGSGGKLSLELGSDGRGFVLRDLTGGSGALTVGGVGALALGLQADSVAASSVKGTSAQRKYVGTTTLLSSLNGGRGVGAGKIKLIDSYGAQREISISSSATTVGDVINTINSSQGSSNVRARINDNGDGILLEEVAKPSGPGARKISVIDVSGSVGRSLGLAKESSATGAGLNRIDGSFERTVTFASTDTLQQVADKINAAGVDAVAAVIADGSSAAPFRLSLTARGSGEQGRFTLDDGGLDLGLSTLTEGTNARVFFGSSDPARAVLLTSSTNSFANLVSGVSINVKSANAAPVTVAVTTDADGISKSVADFVKAFNDVVGRIDTQSKYDQSTDKRGVLLGESSTQSLRSSLVSTILSQAQGASGRFTSLVQVGLGFDREGKLTVDDAKLRAAVAEDPRGVRDLFAARAQSASSSTAEVLDAQGNAIPGVTVSRSTSGSFTQLGVAEKLAQTIDKYIAPIDGVLIRRNQLLDTQVTFQNTRITQIDTRLASKRTNLEAKFTAMEKAIAALQTQSSSISGIKAI